MQIRLIDSGVRQAIMNQLQKHGWVSGRDFEGHFTYGMGTKGYDSAVGVKTAQSYLYPADGVEWKLVAEYYSEGRNALDTTTFHFRPTAELDEIIAGVSIFAEKVDSVVSQTYAVKLLRPARADEDVLPT